MVGRDRLATVIANLDQLTLDRVLRDRVISVVFQPVVHLDTQEIVGFEALARGPAGSVLVSPAALFGEAYRRGQVNELDWLCRAAALRAFGEADLPESMTLFCNVEPASIGSDCPSDLVSTFVDAMARRTHVVLELTERHVARDPAGLLAAVRDARRGATGIALDDVGVDPTSLAFMPLIQPDIIKLDLALVQGPSTRDVARVVNAVMAQAERTGTAILAEGIESERHRAVAQAMGATYGQGFLFGRPGPLPRRTVAPKRPVPAPLESATEISTPIQAVAGRRLARANQRWLLSMSRHLEYQCLSINEPAVVLACFQDANRFHDPTRQRFARLAARGLFTAVLGRNMPSRPSPGVRGARLDPNDPIMHEWSVVVLGPNFAAALLAREVAEDVVENPTPTIERLFDFTMTYDWNTVIAAATPLLTRILAAESQ